MRTVQVVEHDSWENQAVSGGGGREHSIARNEEKSARLFQEVSPLPPTPTVFNSLHLPYSTIQTPRVEATPRCVNTRMRSVHASLKQPVFDLSALTRR